jgi:putative serine protease PepD
MTGGVIVILALVATLFYRWGSSGAAPPQQASGPAPSPSASEPPSTSQIYQTVAPSVVGIVAIPKGQARVEDTGTGVIVNADGTILTALHVVKGAGSIRVTYADGTSSAATVSAADPTMDIATLAPATLPSIVVPAVLGSSARLAVGDTVIAIGNPLGLTDTTTQGIVSGLGRPAVEPGDVHLSGLIQFDAAVNPGSSGGPLLNGKGETVGIVVALTNPTSADTFIGIGLAVPIGSAVAAGGPSRAPQQ